MVSRSDPVRDSLLAPLEVCDRCGAPAKVRVVLDNGGVLYFCGHHAREYRDALQRVARSQQKIPA
jgi:hypothetical protein